MTKPEVDSATSPPPPHLARQRWAEALFYLLLRRSLGNAFHGILIRDAEILRTAAAAGSLVACANHTNWWDGFALSWVTRTVTPRSGFLLAMDEANLSRYAFFRRLGVFGVELRSPRSAALSLRRVLASFQAGPQTCWIFPQGRLLHPTRPVEVQGGAFWLARKGGLPLLPVALSYEWLIESRPTLLIRVAPPLQEPTAEQLSEALTKLRWRIVQDAADLDLNAYEPILPPRLSLNKKWDRVRSWFTRDRQKFDPINR